MELFMRSLFPSVLGVTLLALLIGCGTPDKEKEQKKQANAVPERAAEVTFKNASPVQVKNNLMGACSQNRLRIQPDHTEVICIRHPISEDREKLLTDLMNDDFGRSMTDNIRFSITPDGRDVRVKGYAYLQFDSPLGVMGDAGVKIVRVHLRYDNSFSMVETLLKQAGATQP